MFIPLVIVLVGLIVFSFCGLNLSYDFSDTFSVTARYSSSLEDSVKDEYQNGIIEVMDNHDIKDYQFTVSADSSYTTLTFRYKAVGNKSNSQMIDLGNAVKKDILALGISSENVVVSDVIAPTYDASLIGNLALAMGIGLACVIIYLYIRFDYASASNILLSMIVDWLVLFGIYSICRLPVDISVIAVFGVVTILSLIHNVILYDKVRDNLSDEKNAKLLNNELVSLSIRNNLTTSLYALTIEWIALFMIMAVSIASVKFALLTIIIWLPLNFVSNNMVMPFVWTKMYNRSKDMKLKRQLEKKNEKNSKNINIEENSESTSENK